MVTLAQGIVSGLEYFMKEIKVTREEFRECVKKAVEKIDIDVLAKKFLVNCNTIERWAKGESLPHPLGQQSVLEQINKLLE